MSRILEIVQEVWGYELIEISGAALTAGTLITAILLIVVGYVVSRVLSRSLGRVFSHRVKSEAGQAHAIQTLTFYLLFVGFAVTALRVINFPLTAFTIAGGALAIGVGFGSQNLMNNFISGVILLIERPVRVGDLVEIDTTYGTVEKIGLRSTRVLASENTQIIVPNSFFLQNNIINFTLSDDVIRTQVNVGVIYGSPTRTVENLIRRAIKEHPETLEREPKILFADFGDNSLSFEAYFWLRARSIMERRVIESDIRFRIDDLFREAGLVIAFPQRDVHLDSARPIEVRLLEEQKDAVSEE